MKKLGFVLAWLLVAASAPALLRVVKNGGGLGEMKALQSFQRMEVLTASCVLRPSSCGLSASEAGLLRQVQSAMAAERAGGGLSFFSDENRQRGIETGTAVGSQIRLNSNLLATPEGIAFPLPKIAALVLQALLRHHGVDAGMGASLASKVFATLSETQRTLAAVVDGHEIEVHHLRLLRQSFAHEMLIVEDPSSSHDLTAALEGALSCAKPAWALRGLRWETNGLKIIADVKYGCGGSQNGQAMVALSWKLSGKVIDETSIRADAFGVIKPSTADQR